MSDPAPRAPDPAGLALFLTELHGFFEACDEPVDAALAGHFGFSTAVDWALACLELFTHDLREAAEPVPTSQLSGVET